MKNKLKGENKLTLKRETELKENTSKTKVVIFGGREFTDYEEFIERVVEILDGLELTPDEVEIVEGGARGADRLAQNFSTNFGISHKLFKAEWDKLGKGAGHIRNRKMAEYSDFGIGFWDGKSRGTKNMIDTMKKLDKDVYVVNY